MIGGIIPCSFIDYPKHISAVVFLRRCNLRCPYCHNAELQTANGCAIIDKEGLIEFLSKRKGLLDGVVFSGGEPTLQPELLELIEIARAFGYKIKLDTNGTRPKILQHLVQGRLVDYVAMDLKDEPVDYDKWLGMQEPCEALQQSLDILKNSSIDYELRTTVVWPYHDQEKLSRMALYTKGCPRWFLQPCIEELTKKINSSQSKKNWKK